MRENLRTSHYTDGTPIPEKTLNSDWNNASPAWCWYENNHAYDQPYGKLYNWYAIVAVSNGGKNVCPTGWHVPADAEWTTLTDFLGGTSVAGGKMKEAGLTHWTTPNTGATNESGFSGLPGGYRGFSGSFGSIGYDGYWRSSTEAGSDAWYRFLNYLTDGVSPVSIDKRLGFSVRCVRD
ncbi:MAG: fibrobacter succinogenes major paralogous domain-containing protein [Saprospiraceae bacterium]|nr:fibrobacter succinogenes major paralogous domain-containing protein [Saprospiraceae bacterium]